MRIFVFFKNSDIGAFHFYSVSELLNFSTESTNSYDKSDNFAFKHYQWHKICNNSFGMIQSKMTLINLKQVSTRAAKELQSQSDIFCLAGTIFFNVIKYLNSEKVFSDTAYIEA